MATYEKDFSSESTGAFPSDFTNRWSTNHSSTVETADEPSFGGNSFRYNPLTLDARRLHSWDDIDSDANRDDFDIICRWKINSQQSRNGIFYLIARASGALGSENCYFVQVGVSNYSIRKYVSGSLSSIATGTLPMSSSQFDDSYNWIRFRGNSTTLQCKFWSSSLPEPYSWDIEATDSSIASAGWVGIGGYDDISSSYIEVDYIGVGTNGDSLSLPLTTTGEVQVNQLYVEKALDTDLSPPLYVNQFYSEVSLETIANPEARINQFYMEIAYGTTYVPLESEVEQEIINVHM